MIKKDTVATAVGAIATYVGIKYLHSVRAPTGTLEPVTETIQRGQCDALQRKIDNLEGQIRTIMEKETHTAGDANRIIRLQEALVRTAATRRELGCL